MKLKLILQLSLLGLAMALGDVFFIPPTLSSILWLAVLPLYYAFVIAKNTWSWRFAHGLLLGLLNSTWITIVHEIFVDRYLARHPTEQAMIDMVHSTMHLRGSARDIMSITGPVSGIMVGCVIGVFAVIAGLMRKPKRVELASEPQA